MDGMYNPVNEDHAIDLVRFEIVIDTLIDEMIIAGFQHHASKFHEIFPAVRRTEGVSLNIGPSGLNQIPNGIEFAYLQPDGRPTWLLKLEAQLITVECHVYSRWKNVFSRYIEILELLPSLIGKKITAEHWVLTYIDKFILHSENNHANSLFEPNFYVSDHFIMMTKAWHTHLGWFDELDGTNELVLNNLDIDSTRGTTKISDSDSVRFVTTIRHLQRGPRLGVTLDGLDSLKNRLSTELSHAHSQNKKLISKLLTDEMQNRIGLISGS